MTDHQPGFAQPTDEHRWLMQNVGTWNVACRFFMGPSTPPMEFPGTDTVEAHGPFFTLAKFEADMMGMPFVGMATLGYDPISERFRSTWADTLNPFLYVFTGQLDGPKETLELTGEAVDPHSQQMTRWRSTERRQGDDRRVVEMFMAHPETGAEMKLFEHLYTRG